MGWPEARRVIGTLLLLGLGLLPAPARVQAQDSLADLPAGPGQVLVFAMCTACHGIKLVKAQGMSRRRWEETLQLMIEKNGMRPPDPDVRGQIVDYLAAVFPEHMGGGPPAAATGGLEDMPDGQGRVLTFAMCTACHGIRIVKAQGMSRARWEDTLEVMIEKNGMPVPEPAIRAQIVDYLSHAFPERRGRPNPFLK